MSDKNTNSGGIGFSGLLLTAFIVLKLCGVINWSWWWVMAPLWIPLSVVLLILAIIATVAIIGDTTEFSFKSSTTRKQDREMKKLRKKMRKGEVSTNRFIKMVDALLDKHESNTEPINPFSLLDIKASDSTEKSIRRHREKTKKNKFSLSRWWKEGCTGLTLFQKIKKWYTNGNKKATLFKKIKKWYISGNKKTEEKKKKNS